VNKPQPAIPKIGRYIVLDVIGAGGMGTVYRAQDPDLGRIVAIKMISRPHKEQGSPGDFDRIFFGEMRSIENLRHRNIVTVFDIGEQDGSPYTVYEYLEGEPVSKIISEQRPISLREKLNVIIQVCDGLDYAHRLNIVHSDIKPENVILQADGTAKLVDFGAARIAASDTSLEPTGRAISTLSYMSPEQFNSPLSIDGRSDIFSTGVMLYQLLTGELPFNGSDPSSTILHILQDQPRPLSDFIPDVPPALQAVVNRALAKDVQDRYQSADEFGLGLIEVQRKLTLDAVADCLTRAQSAMRRADLERARVLLHEAIRLDPDNTLAHRLFREIRVQGFVDKARCEIAERKFDDALQVLRTAVQAFPHDPQLVDLLHLAQEAMESKKLSRERPDHSLSEPGHATGAIFRGGPSFDRPPMEPPANANQTAEHDDPFRIVIAHPRSLSKGANSTVLVILHLPSEVKNVRNIIQRDFGEESGRERQHKITRDKTDLTYNTRVFIELYSQDIEFSGRVALELSKPINRAMFLAKPRDGCRVGKNQTKVIVRDIDGEIERYSGIIQMKITDYVFDHVSRPMLSHCISASLTVGSFITFVLTTLGKLDHVLGITTGATALLMGSTLFGKTLHDHVFRKRSSPSVSS
jgi:hypothetical protein